MTFQELCAWLKKAPRTMRREIKRYPNFPLLWVGGEQRFEKEKVYNFYLARTQERQLRHAGPARRARQLGVKLC